MEGKIYWERIKAEKFLISLVFLWFSQVKLAAIASLYCHHLSRLTANTTWIELLYGDSKQRDEHDRLHSKTDSLVTYFSI